MVNEVDFQFPIKFVTTIPYRTPPIAEALVELRFAGGQPWETTEAELLSEFGKIHSGERRELKTYELRAEWKAGEVSTKTDGQFSRWLLPNKTGSELIGIGPDVLSVHVIAPYPGWSHFRPAIDRAFAIYEKIAQPITLLSTAVRYIDQIILPKQANFAEYFRALPSLLPSQPKGLEAFQVTTEAIDSDNRVRSRLTLVSGPVTNDDKRVVIYDLDLRHTFEADTQVNQWPEMVELLHSRQKMMFEESITPATRELFNV